MVGRAVQSVLEQRTPVFEIVVVDDGSIDHTSEDLSRRFPDVKVVRLSGMGPGPARNAGVNAASGDVLMFLDSDDQWLPNHVGNLLSL